MALHIRELNPNATLAAKIPLVASKFFLARHARLIFRHALLSIAFVLIYLLLDLPGTIFIARLGSSTWYPANGLVLALLLGVSPWYAPLVAFSDALGGFLIYHQPIKSFGETLGASGAGCCYAGAAYLLRGPLRMDCTLLRGRDVVRYLAVTAAAAVGATLIGVVCLVADHTIPWSGVYSAAPRWFVGDEIGLLGLAPFLLIHVLPWIRERCSLSGGTSSTRTRPVGKVQTASALLEGTGQAITIVFILGVMFWPPLGNYTFLSFIPILWMAMRQGVGRVTTGIVAFTFGVIAAMHLFPPPQFVLSRIGLLMLVVSAAGLIVGSAVTERLLVESDLRERTAYLNSLIENSPLGIVVLGHEGRVELVNEAFTRLFLFENPTELVGGDLDELLPSDFSGLAGPWSQQVIAGQTLKRTVRSRRRDGRVLDLELQAVPLAVDGLIRGAYTICRDISEQVQASEAAREHAVALNQLVKELELQTDQMTLLNEMANMLECCASIKEACTVVQEFTRKLFPTAVSGGLHTFRASRNLLEAAVTWGDSGPAHPVFAPGGCWALRRGRPHWSDASAKGVTCPHLHEVLALSHLCIPMVGQGEMLGILRLGFSGIEAGAVASRHSLQRLALSVAAQIALSLGSLQLHEKLRSQSIRDPLTGLFNRRFMQESLDKEMIRARRKGRPLSLLFLDIDHFKRFNDTFGHDAGDFVLQSFAELLSRFFRGDDVACRWGGEEFAVILPESLQQDAAVRANSLRTEVQKLGLQYRGTRLDPITISIGVATFPEHASASEELLRIADQCLYQSKSAGRDCVTVASPVTV
jgi:diguanylate cyclase (GGDEF)-like protein/PAS domain S-box-containing protein